MVRFDIYVQSQFNAQNYNRYSYCFNNPMMFTDPTGWINEPRYRDSYIIPERSSANNNMWVNLPSLPLLQENNDKNKKDKPKDSNSSVKSDQSKEVDVKQGAKKAEDKPATDGSNPQSNESNPKSQEGIDFSLALMYLHFQFGGGNPLTINSSSLDFSGTSQRELGLNGMKKGESREASLFKTGINAQSLAFGRLEFTYEGNNQFSIADNMFDFDYQAGQSFSRNTGTIVGGAVNYNVFMTLLTRSPIPTLVPMIFGGSYNVIFKGNITIPK